MGRAVDVDGAAGGAPRVPSGQEGAGEAHVHRIDAVGDAKPPPEHRATQRSETVDRSEPDATPETDQGVVTRQRRRQDRSVFVDSAGSDRRRRNAPRQYGCAGAKFSNLVYWPRKVSVTEPIGPLRCLPMMISAMPLFGESGS